MFESAFAKNISVQLLLVFMLLLFMAMARFSLGRVFYKIVN